jgi:hypothetical protein
MNDEHEFEDPRVARADVAISRQRAIVAMLRMMKRDTSLAEDTLRIMLETRDRLVAQGGAGVERKVRRSSNARNDPRFLQAPGRLEPWNQHGFGALRLRTASNPIAEQTEPPWKA